MSLTAITPLPPNPTEQELIDFATDSLPSGTGGIKATDLLAILVPLIHQAFTGGNGGGLFPQDLTVNLSNNRSLGQFENGETINSAGKSAVEVLTEAVSEVTYPTYAVAQNYLTTESPTIGEIGAVQTTKATASFTRNDAGILTQLSITSNGTSLVSGANAAATVSTRITFSATPLTYVALATYGAGARKSLTPASNGLDPRPMRVRDSNAPQAGEVNFASNAISFQGFYRYFWGDAPAIPTVSALVRSLVNNPLSAQLPGTCILNTALSKFFAVAVPPGVTLTSVIDLTALNANITSEYRPQPIQIEDGSGTLVNYMMYVMQIAVPYSQNHQHQLFFS